MNNIALSNALNWSQKRTKVDRRTSSLTFSGIRRPGWNRLHVFLLWTMDRNIDALELILDRWYGTAKHSTAQHSIRILFSEWWTRPTLYRDCFVKIVLKESIPLSVISSFCFILDKNAKPSNQIEWVSLANNKAALQSRFLLLLYY